MNKKRKEGNLNELAIFVIDMVSASKEPFQMGDMEFKISSTDIRRLLKETTSAQHA